MITFPLFLTNLFFAWFQFELMSRPPFVRLNGQNTKELLKLNQLSDNAISDLEDGPIAYTKLGPVLGYKRKINSTRDIFSFTGVPYGEPPVGELRFRSPVMRKPWRHIWKATSRSPYCVQNDFLTLTLIKGQEDCLYLDIHTPRLSKAPGSSGLPVIVWIPAGTNLFGKSYNHGPAYFLKQEVILVVINMRVGILGFLSTGDEASPGNYALKDQALAVEWVYNNIEGFGGDPNRIIIGGISSGGYAAHAMLFTKHISRNYIKGIFSISGNVLANHALDATGRNQNSSNFVARAAGCPTAEEGKSWEMVECLRKMDAYMLQTYQSAIINRKPIRAFMLGPVIEPDVPEAFISELPEVLYEKGEVPPIPLVTTRSEDETSFVLLHLRYSLCLVYSQNWNSWMPFILRTGYRSFKGELAQSEEERQLSLLKITQFYFKKHTPPNVFNTTEFIKFINLINDAMYFASMWKSIELHHKVAPTYSYVTKHKTFYIKDAINFSKPFFPVDKHFGASHATDQILLFDDPDNFPPLSKVPDFETASRNLINFISNFAAHGTPLYRNSSGSLLPLWKPITNMKRPLVLEVGLVHNVTMIKDPLFDNPERLRIWEQVKF